MQPLALSKREARRLILNAQLLDGRADLPPGKSGVLRTIERLGYVQIDTIHIVERAHHQTFWTRLPDYSPELLHDLQAADRAVFEYWAHAMSYLPTADYRFSLARMLQFRDPEHPWRKWMAGRENLPLEPVLARIRAEGPLTAKDFAHPADKKRGTWWDWKPAKSALELLFWQGELMISERRNFQKVYDLTERVLPAETDTRLPNPRELAAHLITRSLAALGVAGPRAIYEYLQPTAARDAAFRAVTWDALLGAFAELEEENILVPVRLEGRTEDLQYALASAVKRIGKIPAPKPEVRLLSPFDNLIIQRDRTRDLFGFDYMLECYTPGRKRVHGYFVLPVLFGDRLVGRIDPQADRKTGTLVVRTVSFEEGFAPSEAFYAKFAKTLAAFAAFNGCSRVILRRTRPAKAKSILLKSIR